jgi:hypothetical protein
MIGGGSEETSRHYKNGTQFNDGVTQEIDYRPVLCSFSSLISKLHQRQSMALRSFEIGNIPVEIASDKCATITNLCVSRRSPDFGVHGACLAPVCIVEIYKPHQPYSL